MDLTDCYCLKWTYTPTDFLEVPLAITGPGYELTFKDGHGLGYIEPTAYPNDNSLRSQLQQQLIARFLAVQALTHKRFTLSNSQVNRIHPGGNSTIAFIEGTVTMTIECAGQLDLVKFDAAGNVISDSKADRIKKTNELMQLAAKYALTDETTDAILRSYSAAVVDSQNEFIHLYEIVDALRRRFSGKDKAQAALKVGDDWDRLHRISNDEPYNQGRHRGAHVGKLQDAPKEVLHEARGIARDLIERYLRMIDAP